MGSGIEGKRREKEGKGKAEPFLAHKKIMARECLLIPPANGSYWPALKPARSEPPPLHWSIKSDILCDTRSPKLSRIMFRMPVL